MEKTRQPIPEGLAEMPPGPGLAAVLSDIDVTRLSGLDCVTVMRARYRQANHEQAGLMASMVEVALCGIGPDDQLPRMDTPDEFSADEIRAALAWTRRAADTQLSLAWDLIHRLPQVFAALDAGSVDVPKTRVFSEWTDGLTDEQARQICDHLIPEAPTLTTGQLAERIKKLAIAVDPAWARRRYEQAVRDRKVVGYRNEDGSANLCGYNLPVDRTAAACAHIDALAKKIKHAGDARPIDHIKADLYLAMLDGSYTGWSEQAIITHLLATTKLADHHRNATGDDTTDQPHHPEASSNAAPARPDHCEPDHPGPDHRGPEHPRRERHSSKRHSADLDGPERHEPERHSFDHGSLGQRGRERHRPELDRLECGSLEYGGGDRSGARNGGVRRLRCADGGEVGGQQCGTTGAGGQGSYDVEGKADVASEQQAEVRQAPPELRAGVEVRAEITTLLGLDDHPGEIAGWGPLHAEVVRRLVMEQTAAEWRFAITDDHGRLLREGITRQRPGGHPSRVESPRRGGIVELQVKLSDLRQLALRSVGPSGWARVIADLARQADRHERDAEQVVPPDQSARDGGPVELPVRDGRRPGVSLRRRTQIRDRTCVYPGCRAPAASTDGDHTRDWANGGATWDGNIGSLCRHDHRLKHEGRWRIVQPESGHFTWTSRLGVHYSVRPPLIIKPLLDPVPRDALAYRSASGVDPPAETSPTWRGPEQTKPDTPPARLRSVAEDAIPPF